MNIEEMSEEQIESEAIKQGYNPNFDGENKKTPKEFLEVAFSHNHVLKERNEKLSSQFDEIKAELEKQKELSKKLVKFQEDAKKKAVEKAIKSLKEERKEAITEGDHEKVELIDQQIDEQKEEIAPKPPAEFQNWVEKNQWYLNDAILGAEADVFAEQFVKSGRFDTREEIFKAVEAKIKRLYPEKFENPKKKETAEVEGGRPSSSKKKSEKSYADLPADAKKACDEFVEAGLMSKEDYIAMYEWE